jgi:tRNA threonylcarbamoyladenosine biosynthesis protein TsaE
MTENNTPVSIRLVSNAEEETERIGAALAKHLIPGDSVCLTGDLGTGKTCLIRGAVRALTERPDLIVQSPSFVLMRPYLGYVPIYHFDLYRLGDQLSIEQLGFEEYLYSDSISFIEWCEKMKGPYPPQCIRIFLSFLDDTSREIRIEFPPGRKNIPEEWGDASILRETR